MFKGLEFMKKFGDGDVVEGGENKAERNRMGTPNRELQENSRKIWI